MDPQKNVPVKKLMFQLPWKQVDILMSKNQALQTFTLYNHYLFLHTSVPKISLVHKTRRATVKTILNN